MQLKVDDYILHKRFGIGRIEKIDTGFIIVRFHTGEKKTMIYDAEGKFYDFIPNDDLLLVKEMLNDNKWEYKVKQRAYEYADLDHFYDFSYNMAYHKISATVKGSSEYRVSLLLKRQDTTCTCPYYDHCKHEYALLLLLNSQMDFSHLDIENEYEEELIANTNNQPTIEELTKLGNEFIDNYLDIEKMIALYNVLKATPSYELKDDFVKDFFNRNYKNMLVLRGIVDVLTLSSPSYMLKFDYDLIQKGLGNETIVFQEREAIDNSKYFSSSDSKVSMQYFTYECIVLKRYRKYFDALIKNKFLLKSDFAKVYFYNIYEFLKTVNLNITPLFTALCKIKSLTCYDNIIKDIYSNLNNREKEIFFIELPERFMYELDPKDLIDQMNFYNAEKILKILIKVLPNYTEEDRISSFNKLLFHEGLSIMSYKKRELLDEIIKTIPPCPFLSVLNDRNPYDSGKFKILKVKDLYFNKDIEIIDTTNFELYFDVHAEVQYYEDDTEIFYQEIYFLDTKGGRTIIEACIDPYSPTVNVIHDEVDELNETKYIKFMIAYANFYDDKFKLEKANSKTKLEQMLQAKMDAVLLDTFKEINDITVNDYCTQLSKDNLVGFDYYIYSNLEIDDYFIQFKIGMFKKYSVSNIRTMLYNFDSERENKYGKGLSFKHTLDNLLPEDRPVINYLIGLVENIMPGKYLRLNENQFNNFLFLLKGRVINFDDTPCKVNLERYPYKIELTDKYNLTLPNIDPKSVIKNHSTYYYFDKKTGNLDILEDEKGKIKLIDLIINNKNVSIERVKKQFIQDVYPIYEKEIHVDEKIAKEFVSSALTIEAYFDIDKNNEINLKTKYIKNDKAIKEEEITLPNDIGKLHKFKTLISGLGFIDGLLKDQTQIFNFFGLDFTTLKEVCDVYLSEALSNKKVMTFVPPKIRMQFESNLMNVILSESKFSDEELWAILNGIKNKKRFVLLKDDHIIDLQDEEVKKFAEAVEDLSLDKKHLTKEVKKPVYQTLAAFSHLDNVELDDYLTKMVDDIREFKKSKKHLPELNAKLRTYQKQGYNWLKILTKYNLGGILADDMGLGKTLETIALIASDETEAPTLIVAPKSLVFNWISEFDKFAPYIETQSIYGTADQRYAIIDDIDPFKKKVYLTSYDSLRNDCEHYDKNFNYLILDEAQYIKNVHALKTIKIKQVNATHRFALTGTPIENDIFDLWSIFDFLMPGYLPNLNQFKEHSMDDDFKDLIARRVAPFILRRTKQDVLKDLPEKFERVISADMSDEQRKIYDAMCLEARQSLEKDGKKFDVLHLLMRLRQICVDPRTFMDNFKGKSGKMELLKDIIKEYIANGHRILIFSQFVSALNIVETFLNKEKIKYFMITGKTKGEDRIEFVNEFNKNEEIKIFLISLKAGGNGLNLVGSDTVIHLDPWWNLAAENQATDRAYRIGQTKNVEVIRLISEDSIEQRVIELQYKKKDLIDKLISDDTSSIEKMSVEDLKFILD